MVYYTKSNDHSMEHNEYVKHKSPHTSLLERFFMLITRTRTFEEMERTMLTPPQMEDLFLELMKLLMPNPQRGFITKLL
jgi:hypothetical protein